MEDNQKIITLPTEQKSKTFDGGKEIIIKIVDDESVLFLIPNSDCCLRFIQGKFYKVPCSLADILFKQAKAIYTIKYNETLKLDDNYLNQWFKNNAN